MRKIEELKSIIADQFASDYKAYDLKGACEKYGILPDNSLDPMSSKRVYVANGLNKMYDDDIWNLAKQLFKELDCKEFIKLMEPFLGDKELEFSFITRRRIVDYVLATEEMEGNMSLDDFLSTIWDLSQVVNIFDGMTVGREILTAVKINKSMSYRELLTNRLEIKFLPDETISKFLECLVMPEVRDGEKQKEYVQGLNTIIKEDGYALYEDSNLSGTSIYRIDRRRFEKGILKNLIFAPIGVKPDIVIENSISNEIKIVGDTENCLLYNFEPDADGLMWESLIEWWNISKNDLADDPELSLYNRLKESLDSEIEKTFFKTFYNYFRHPVKRNIPALIPQVFLHYDPRSKYQRKGQSVFSHQRMDFLMLLPDSEQIIIELDGKQHYSINGMAKPQLYAEMVKDDRELQLKGYEVYRFGGYEFVDSENAEVIICTFFDKLFQKHDIVV